MVLILVPTLEGSSEDQMIESHGLTQSTQLVLVVTFFVVAIIFFIYFILVLAQTTDYYIR